MPDSSSPPPPGGQTPGGQTPGSAPGADGLPDGTHPTGGQLPGDGSGPAPLPGEDAGWETRPGGAPGAEGDEPGTPPAGGSTGEGGAAGDGSWESGAAEGDDGWATSNQVPDGNPIPPMPSERDRRAGGGDGGLDGALEEFDGEILAEREVIRSRTNESAGNTTAGLPPAGGATGDGTSGPAANTSTTGTADIPMPRGGMGIPSSRREPPTPRPPGDVTVPDDIPNAQDDDIIARQLREAAMQESDPGLREKLWDEYRKYKGI